MENTHTHTRILSLLHTHTCAHTDQRSDVQAALFVWSSFKQSHVDRTRLGENVNQILKGRQHCGASSSISQCKHALRAEDAQSVDLISKRTTEYGERAFISTPTFSLMCERTFVQVLNCGIPTRTAAYQMDCQVCVLLFSANLQCERPCTNGCTDLFVQLFTLLWITEICIHIFSCTSFAHVDGERSPVNAAAVRNTKKETKRYWRVQTNSGFW